MGILILLIILKLLDIFFYFLLLILYLHIALILKFIFLLDFFLNYQIFSKLNHLSPVFSLQNNIDYDVKCKSYKLYTSCQASVSKFLLKVFPKLEKCQESHDSINFTRMVNVGNKLPDHSVNLRYFVYCKVGHLSS